MEKFEKLLMVMCIIFLIGFNYSNKMMLSSKGVKSNNIVRSKLYDDKNIVELKSIDNIDLSGIQYFISEKNRDPRLEEAIAKAYNLEKGKDKFKYYFNRVQLNNDMEPETFVYLVGPKFSGEDGCSAAIFSCENGEYKLLSRFTLVNNPIIITNGWTNGYRDIIVHVSGGGAKESYAYMKFDGAKYPENPYIQQKVVPNTKLTGVAIIADDVNKSSGIEF
ncbi:hypothetical protein KQI86_16535 [Clostridium sp. MSJ-11]|uniref:Lipoprotein n=1 Tax=Clostridium mobile TaxID=2841512 RepID=A0ABS6ELN5_9CLOT|nr:hypothetical protein [Clostridium mobile]MBU5485930.1 hypothetical protein [Clostridium mobile]